MKNINVNIEVTMPAKLTLAIVNEKTWLKNKSKFLTDQVEILEMINHDHDSLQENFGLAWESVEEDVVNKEVTSVVEIL